MKILHLRLFSRIPDMLRDRAAKWFGEVEEVAGGWRWSFAAAAMIWGEQLNVASEVYETEEPFAWVSTTTDDDRTKLKDRFVTGKQPILVITPDSLEQRLRDTIKNAAGAGRLRALVIDEAHLFTQWGRSFKPQYREMAALRKEILERARSVPGQVGFRTVLLSATVGAAELRDLHFHFSFILTFHLHFYFHFSHLLPIFTFFHLPLSQLSVLPIDSYQGFPRSSLFTFHICSPLFVSQKFRRRICSFCEIYRFPRLIRSLKKVW
jgi:hypothetical protein